MKALGLQCSDPKSSFHECLEALNDLECHGFDIKPIVLHVKKMLSMKAQQELTQENEKIDEEISVLRKKVLESMEQIKVLESMKQKNSFRLNELCSPIGGQPQNGLAHCNGGGSDHDISRDISRGKLNIGVAEEAKGQQKPCSVDEQDGVNKEQAASISANVFPSSSVARTGPLCVQPKKSQSSSTRKRNKQNNAITLTREAISEYFHMPITQAAKEMNTGLTQLKSRCREVGISRWPRRKLKSLQTLINNVQEMGDDGEVEKISKVVPVEILKKEIKLAEQVPDRKLGENIKKMRQAIYKTNFEKRRRMVDDANEKPF